MIVKEGDHAGITEDPCSRNHRDILRSYQLGIRRIRNGIHNLRTIDGKQTCSITCDFEIDLEQFSVEGSRERSTENGLSEVNLSDDIIYAGWTAGRHWLTVDALLYHRVCVWRKNVVGIVDAHGLKHTGLDERMRIRIVDSNVEDVDGLSRREVQIYANAEETISGIWNIGTRAACRYWRNVYGRDL